MKSLFIVITILVSQLAWANSDAVNSEDFKPIGLEETAAAKMIEQAVAEAQAVAETNTPEPVALTVEASTAPTATATTLINPKDTKNLKESEIPVLTKAASQKSEGKSPWSRLFVSFAIIGIVAAGLYQAAKWWQKKTAINSDNNKIKILNQHFLGPRKSLAIIRVAGENILIGVTDSNITHIKTLSLMEDEEIPTEVPQNFAAELDKKESKESDESAWSFVRDRVSTKIKDMRPL
ncbi:MAG: flagellar biosynthetic protein FliO [Bdellovibrionota bacterium]